jgi:DNA polymerase-3 subunit gamma/tau
MSYLALARKWRPRRFEDVMGQPHVVQALKHALDGDKLHPAILLTGTRGVGKTTLGRIIAKGLNCETGVTGSPCGKCPSCLQLDEGRFVDLLEIDAASHTGVDDVRELIEKSQYTPARGRYKVYLIDEVHMLSRNAFNALLKTLEEPPPHVKFILATTDPQKLPVTVLSRCLQFNLKRLPAAVVRQLLEKVLAAEGQKAEPGAVIELAHAADGSMRDGLSLLDQAIVFSGGKELKRAQMEEMLGTQGRRLLFEVLRAVADGKADALPALIDKLDAQAPDYSALLNDLAAALQRMAVLQLLPKTGSEDDAPEVVELAARISPEDVQLYYQIVINGRRDLPWVPDPRLGFEMTLLRLLTFRPGGAATAAPSAPGRSAATPAAPAPSRAASAVAPGTAWEERIEALGLDGFAKQLARHCEWLEHAGDAVKLRLDVRMKHLLADDRRATIERALAQRLGRPVKVTIEVGASQQTPARLDEQREADRKRAAEAAIDADPQVRALREKFGATVRAGSVEPLDNGANQ